MKTILLLISLLFNLIVFSQNPDLQSKNWVVSSLTVNGVTTIPNYNPVSFPYVELIFYSGNPCLVGSSNQSTLENCAVGFTGHVDLSVANEFHFTNFSPFNISANCTSDCTNFINTYLTFFSPYINDNFQYFILETGVNSHSLTLTNSNGDMVMLVDEYAPTPEGIDRNWTLSYMILNNEYIFPDNYYGLKYQLDFSNNLFHTSHCNWMVAEISFFDDVNYEYDKGELYLYDNTITLLDYCTPFEGIYINFYGLNVAQPYQYELVQYICSCPDGLHITDTEGNVAVYYDATMSSETLETSQINIFPNPAKDWIEIKNDDNIPIKQINIYNNLGQSLLYSVDDKINVSNLSSGVYNIFIELNNGNVGIKKLIKS